MAAHQTVRQLWEIFQDQAIPRSAPLIQKREMKKAFYAGAASLLSSLKNLDEEISEEAGAAILEAHEYELKRELAQFVDNQ